MPQQNIPNPTWRKLASLILVNGQLAKSPASSRLINTWLTRYTGNFLPGPLFQDIFQALLSVLKQNSEQVEPGEIERAASIQIFLQEDVASSTSSNPPQEFPEAHSQSELSPEIQISGHHVVGSWGYFLVERTQSIQDSPGRVIYLQVDVYLYSESGSQKL